MTMDENQGPALGIKSESMELESKEIYELHDSSRDISEANGRKNHKVADGFSVDDANETVDSQKKECQNGRSQNPGDQENECLMTVEEHLDHKENKSRESSPPRNDSSCLVEGETMDSFADKNVLHTELPELEVCYKEIDQHIVKDICVDEGKPEKGVVVNASLENDKPGHCLPQPVINKAKEGFHKEFFASEEEEISLQKNPNVVSSDQHGSEEQKNSRIDSAKEGFNKAFFASQEEESSLQKNPNIVSPNQHGSEEQQKDSRIDLVPSSEVNISTTGEAAADSTEDLSLVDKRIPVSEIGMQGFIKSVLESLDGEGNAAKQWSPQIADKQSVPQSLAMALVKEEAQQEVAHCSSPSDNTSVESGIETGRTEDVKEQLATSREAHDERIQPGDKSRSSANDEALSAQTITDPKTITDPHISKHERWTPDSASIMGRMQKDDGETSFSAASLVNYSEPVAFSGSISHRSDSSATSTRSFAFPVLQSEWNSSPVRMAKADRRRLRKQGGWRSGVFCCRF